MWEKISIWILALPFTSRDLQQVLWALWGCFSYPNGDDNDVWGCGEGEWLLLWINHRPPSFQIVNQTRPGSKWRLRHSNWLVISTAGLVTKYPGSNQASWIHHPHPTPATQPPSSGTWLWGQWIYRATPRRLQGVCQAASAALVSRRENSQWEG